MQDNRLRRIVDDNMNAVFGDQLENAVLEILVSNGRVIDQPQGLALAARLGVVDQDQQEHDAQADDAGHRSDVLNFAERRFDLKPPRGGDPTGHEAELASAGAQPRRIGWPVGAETVAVKRDMRIGIEVKSRAIDEYNSDQTVGTGLNHIAFEDRIACGQPNARQAGVGIGIDTNNADSPLRDLDDADRRGWHPRGGEFGGVANVIPRTAGIIAVGEVPIHSRSLTPVLSRTAFAQKRKTARTSRLAPPVLRRPSGVMTIRGAKDLRGIAQNRAARKPRCPKTFGSDQPWPPTVGLNRLPIINNRLPQIGSGPSGTMTNWLRSLSELLVDGDRVRNDLVATTTLSA